MVRFIWKGANLSKVDNNKAKGNAFFYFYNKDNWLKKTKLIYAVFYCHDIFLFNLLFIINMITDGLKHKT